MQCQESSMPSAVASNTKHSPPISPSAVSFRSLLSVELWLMRRTGAQRFGPAMEGVHFRRAEGLRRVIGGNTVAWGLWCRTENAGHRNCSWQCMNKTKTWFVLMRPREGHNQAWPPTEAREVEIAVQIAEAEHAESVTCTWTSVMHPPVSLRIYSIFGQFLCEVETGIFATGEDLRYAAAHILDLNPRVVEMYMNDDEFLMSNTLTLWEQNVHQDTVLTLRRLGYEGL